MYLDKGKWTSYSHVLSADYALGKQLISKHKYYSPLPREDDD